MTATTYDAKCYDLAQSFMSDYSEADCFVAKCDRAQTTIELAREIQTVIDEFLTEKGLM